MTNEDKLGVHRFFESYRAAFEALDAQGVTDHFTFPLHITSDAGEISISVIETWDEWIKQVVKLFDMYRAIGFSSARVIGLTEHELSPRLFQAVVHWGLYKFDDGILYDFNAMYTVVMINDRLHIAAISHNEIPRYQAFLSTLKSKLT